MEYIGFSGNSVYLISSEYDEAIGFDQYGSLISDKIYSSNEVLLDCFSVTEVDIFSILGVPGVKYSEVYYKGKYAVIRKEYMSIFQTLNKLGVNRVNGLVYTLSREGIGTQVLLPVIKNSIDMNKLSYAFPGIKWNPLVTRLN